MALPDIVSWPLSAEARERAILAPYAMHGRDSAGRRHAEPPHPYRGPFQRDRDRIVHSSAYRRLSSKTQVFVGVAGDYHRTRLTHTLEVASVSRTLSRALALNEDLTEAMALAHDIGHPPFGHAGEAALDTLLAAVGGFSHNAQALRIVEELESRYPDFPGLNLSLELLEGQRYRIDKQPGALGPLLEAQVVDAADSMTYDTHDADDALELGLVELGDLLGLALWREAARRVRQSHAALSNSELRRAVLHELLDWQVSDLVAQSGRRLLEHGVASAEAARRAPILIAPSLELAEQKRELESFLFARVYRHSEVSRPCQLAQQRIAELFAIVAADLALLPPRYRARAESQGTQSNGLLRSVGDYLAGMTDRYFQQVYERLAGRSFDEQRS